ncbi:glycogen synthase GlgA [Aeromonas cavernicola]|uniref:Glycogen synthase n=1 Tax=Aeromonas cavernicola TaxID=1006623 RepID=A0A2H9U6C1_9GAMM|nr:glycogen synthase GlgA [Aeromonas cavernicola]PJG59561.1 glycogen synthase GlgA [Aeromonas cavernicola]
MDTNSLKILFVASEVEGLVKTGGLADVARALPLYLTQHGHDVRIMLPFYQSIKRRDEATLLGDYSLPTYPGLPALNYRIYQLTQDGVCIYLLDYPPYFERAQLYAENNEAYSDNGERFAFLAAAALHACEQLGFAPDIAHCNDWHTGLLPLLLKTRYAHHPFFKQTRSVISIHNAAFQGIFGREQFWAIPEIADYEQRINDDYGSVNLLKCGVLYADKINAVSPNYAQELLTNLGAHGMAHIFQQRAADLCGILNGCDYQDWDPQFDDLLPATYHVDDLAGKHICKQRLQQEMGLPVVDLPIYGMVCRLTEQKGVHLLLPILATFLRHQVQVVIVGSGDPALANQLQAAAQLHPGKLVFINTYDDRLAHLVEAGADFFLMPSLFEPCGLNQMYSLAYGTLPLVRAVGGLKDTVVDWDDDPIRATGFCFEQPTAATLLDTLRRSLICFLQDKAQFTKVQRHAMQTRFHWPDSVIQYEQMYLNALGRS